MEKDAGIEKEEREVDLEQRIEDVDTLKHAQQATDTEHSMTLMQGLRKYPAACGWSFLFSAALIMEGFDKAFLTAFFAFPAFTRRVRYISSNNVYMATVRKVLRTIFGRRRLYHTSDHFEKPQF